jgi:DNA-binding NtrC family response regulator
MKNNENKNSLASVLVIEHDKDMIRDLLKNCAQRGIAPIVLPDTKQICRTLDTKNIKTIFLGKESGNETSNCQLRTLNTIKEVHPEMPVIKLTKDPSSQSAVKALKLGFADVITAPLDQNHLKELLDRFCPNHKMSIIESAANIQNNSSPIIGQSRALAKTVELARKVAPTSAPVLISGESGTGKELIAKLIHSASKRANAPYVKVNCAAINDSLLESELFGHEKGAFTGAHQQHKGRFERAHGGTLLLDEITETPPPFQAKLLRVLEEMDFERVGGSENININVRVISTTNKNIEEIVENGKFRPDLYYRLCAVTLNVPPLRKRINDLEHLIWYFINQFSPETGRIIASLDPSMMDQFRQYHWPGNVRQLRNIIRKSLILGNSPVLSLDYNISKHKKLQYQQRTDDDNIMALAGTNLQQLEQQAILATLKQNSGNRTQTAKQLGISDRTLRDKIKKYRNSDTENTQLIDSA